MAIKNKSQIEESRDPSSFFLRKYCKGTIGMFFDFYPYCPLGHLRSVLTELEIIDIDDWSDFLAEVKEDITSAANLFAFVEKMEDEITDKMRYSIMRVVCRRTKDGRIQKRVNDEIKGYRFKPWMNIGDGCNVPH